MLDSILDAPQEAPVTAKAVPFSRQIDALKKGESTARVQRLPMDSEEAQDLGAFTKRFRLGIDAQVSKIRNATLRDYVVEQGTILTASGHVLVVITVTRT